MKGCDLASGKKVWRRTLGLGAGMLLASFLWFYPGIAAAQSSLTLSWNTNAESDLAGYKVYYGTASGTYGAPIDVGNVITYEVTGLSERQTYHFAVTAYDQAGNESAKSQEASGMAPDRTAPAPPSGLTVSIP